MRKLVLFEISGNRFALDHKLLKQTYSKDAFFSDRAERAKRIKVTLNGQDIPLWNLPGIFGGEGSLKKITDREAMLVKDTKGHMVLLADKIEGTIEVPAEDIRNLPAVFGKQACRSFPQLFVKDGLVVLIMDTFGIGAIAEDENKQLREEQ